MDAGDTACVKDEHFSTIRASKVVGYLVDEDEIKQATRWYVEHEHTIVEPTAAVALAGFQKRYKEFKGKNVVVIACGRNLDLGKLQNILKETKSQ